MTELRPIAVQALALPGPYLLFLGDTVEPGYAKTAIGLRDWAGPGYAAAHWGMSAPQTVTWMWNRENARAQFDAAQRVMKEAEADPSGRLHGIVFPAQIDTVEEDMLRESIAFAGETGRPFTTHIAQAVVEVREMIRRHGITPIQWAASIGLLSAASP